MAKAWFESEFGKSKTISPPTFPTASFTGDSTTGDYYFNQTFQITPAWTQATISNYLSIYPIVIVPVQPIAFLDANEQGYALIFYRDSLNQVSAKLQVYDAMPLYKAVNADYAVNNFSGIFYQICLDGKVQRVLGFENGQTIQQIFLPTNQNLGRFGATSRGPCTQVCYGQRATFVDYIRCAFCMLFKMDNGGASGGTIDRTNTPPPPALGYGVSDFYDNRNPGGGGNNNGGGGSLDSQIDNSFFQTVTIAHIRVEFEANGLLDLFNELRLGDYLTLRNVHKFLKIRNFDLATVITLRQYLDENVKFEDFEDFFQNSQNFRLIDDFLVKYNFSEDAKKIMKIHSDIFKSDVTYATETLQEQKIPVPIILWILKAGGETIIDAAIDVAFGFLTGIPPNPLDHLMSFGTNLIGTGEVAQAAKITKYLAKIVEIVNKVRHIPGGNALADRVVLYGDNLLNVIQTLDLTKIDKATAKLRGAFDDLVGAAYETRIAASVIGTVKGVAVRGTQLANAFGLDMTQLNDIAARLGRNVNDIEIDVVEEVAGKISIGECKAKEIVEDYANYKYKSQLLNHAALAKEVHNATGKDVYVTMYVMNMSDAVKQSYISRLAQEGVSLNIVIRQ